MLKVRERGLMGGGGKGQDLIVWMLLKTLVNVEKEGREGREGQRILIKTSQKKNAGGAFSACQRTLLILPI